MKELINLKYGPHGERNALDLFLPDNPSGAVPLVLCIHGGGWCGGSKEGLRWVARRIVEEGLAAASITYRFWPDWPAPTAMDDVQRAARWLRAHAADYGLDAARFGAIGDSAGGHLASYLGLTETRQRCDDQLAAWSSRVSCVVDCYGPVDFVAMIRSASASIVEGFMAKPLSADTVAAYIAASPVSFVTGSPPPFLIIHGSLDVGTKPGEVPITISESFARQLCAAGGDASFVKLEGIGHGFMGDPDSPHAQQAVELARSFFRKHLRSE